MRRWEPRPSRIRERRDDEVKRFAVKVALCAIVLAFFTSVSPIFASGGVEVRLRLAELHPTDHPTARADYEFARLVFERSGGRIQISVYADSVLGQEITVLEQVQFGAIDMARVSLSAVASYVPRLNALQMPYLYRDGEHMWRVLKGDVGKQLLESVKDAGFVGLGWFEAGSRNFYNSKRPIRSPADLRGLKIRVQESSLMMDMIQAFGGIPVQQAFGEVYNSLQMKSIDGAENNIPTYLTSRHYQIAGYYSLTGHVRIPEIIVGSAVGFSSLTQAERDLIAKAAMDTIDYQRNEWALYENIAAGRVAKEGIKVERIQDTSIWETLAKPLYEKQSPEIKAWIARIKAVK